MSPMTPEGGWRLDDSELSVTIFSPVCAYCLHYRDDRKCDAFGDSPIPEKIWEGQNEHRQPFPGDHGLQFEANAGGKKFGK